MVTIMFKFICPTATDELERLSRIQPNNIIGCYNTNLKNMALYFKI